LNQNEVTIATIRQSVVENRLSLSSAVLQGLDKQDRHACEPQTWEHLRAAEMVMAAYVEPVPFPQTSAISVLAIRLYLWIAIRFQQTG
jgi:hypothetical protein